MSNLKFGNRPNGGSKSSWKAAPGVYINRGVIKAARIEYNTSIIESSPNKDDVAIRMKIQQEGLDWDKELYVGGRFKKSPTPQGQEVISGWSSAFKVARVFDVLGIPGQVSDDGKFPSDSILALAGKTIYFLQYVRGLGKSGKPAYSDYRLIEALGPEDTEEDVTRRLLDLFNRDLEEGFIKNFDPSVLADVTDEDITFEVSDSDDETSSLWG